MWVQGGNTNNVKFQADMTEFLMFLYIDNDGAYQPVLIFEQLYFVISILTKKQKSFLPLFKCEIKKFRCYLKIVQGIT